MVARVRRPVARAVREAVSEEFAVEDWIRHGIRNAPSILPLDSLILPGFQGQGDMGGDGVAMLPNNLGHERARIDRRLGERTVDSRWEAGIVPG